MRLYARGIVAAAAVGMLALACRTTAPDSSSGGDGDGGTTGGGFCVDTDGDELPEVSEEDCTPLATDYLPGAPDDWPACISDDGSYHLVGDIPGSASRVSAYEQIADLLWRNGMPNADDFLEARTLYVQDGGLQSRLQRREDLHHPQIPEEDWDPGFDDDKQCSVIANQEKYPDRCAGPAKIMPLVEDSFDDGMEGTGDPRVRAARIEAGLLWFFHLSVYKEAFTCTSTQEDCDSSWAYYTGAEQRPEGIGLSAVVRGHSELTHDRIFDGVLAARCWRDLYPQADYPLLENAPLEGQALFAAGWEQLDDALHRGFALIVRERLAAQVDLCDSEAAANWAFVQVAGPVLAHEANERDPAGASTLADLWEMSEPTFEDIASGIDTIDRVFDCP